MECDTAGAGEFRGGAGIEYSFQIYDETSENRRKEMIFYPSSAELAANGLIRIGRCCSFLMRRLAEKKNTF